nr:hypothetical protein CoNPh38_CDS0235 [Staphylococcus phage S-CoN_Ph38]
MLSLTFSILIPLIKYIIIVTQISYIVNIFVKLFLTPFVNIYLL